MITFITASVKIKSAAEKIETREDAFKDKWKWWLKTHLQTGNLMQSGVDYRK